ncbi:MAG: hypothetical protein ACOC3G_07815, partial [Phycisphaeraceae bacterium]
HGSHPRAESLHLHGTTRLRSIYPPRQRFFIAPAPAEHHHHQYTHQAGEEERRRPHFDAVAPG